MRSQASRQSAKAGQGAGLGAPAAPMSGPRRARRSQEQRRTETRRKLLDAAIAQLCEVGYAEFTAADVADRAGLTRGAVQHHFGTGDNLCLAVVKDFGDRLQNWALLDEQSARSVEQRVSDVIDTYWNSFRDPHFIAVVLVWFGLRNNKVVYDTLAGSMEAFERTFDEDWQKMFADTGLPRAQIAVARHVTLSALRGLALRTIYRKRPTDWSAELVLLKRMLVSTFATG